MPSRKGILFAEELSGRTNLPVGGFPGNPKFSVDSPDDKVFTPDEAKALLLTKPKPFPKEKSKVRPVKTSKTVDSDKVASALRSIGGILCTLSEGERYQVLSKVQGAFHFSPKGRKESVKGTKKEGKPANAGAKPKSPKEKAALPPAQAFNKAYDKTLEGILLKELDGIVSKVTRSMKPEADKVSQEVYIVHRYLLKKKAAVKLTKKTEELLPFKSTERDPPSKMLSDLVSSSLVLCKEINPNGDETVLASIFEAGLCLLQGSVGPAISLFKGNFPPRGSWPAVSYYVQRTDEEKAARALRILALKERKKEKRTAKASESEAESGGSSVSNAKADNSETPEVQEISMGVPEEPDLQKFKRAKISTETMS